MKKLFLFLAIACSVSTVSTATIYTVIVRDNVFSPASFTAHVGDTVRWTWMEGAHTTTSAAIPAGAASWDFPITSTATTYTYRLTHAGTYNYVCTPHVSVGMVGSITVTSATSVQSATPVVLFHIAPNPAAGTLHIELSAEHDQMSISITDALGRVVNSGNYSRGKTIDLSTAGLANGLYIIRATAAGQVYTQTIEIAH